MDFEDGRGSGAKEGWLSLETGKGKETDFPIQPPGETQACQHLDFNPVRSVSGFQLAEL